MSKDKLEYETGIGFDTFPPDLGTTRVDLFPGAPGKIIQRCWQRSGSYEDRELVITDPDALAARFEDMAKKLRGH